MKKVWLVRVLEQVHRVVKEIPEHKLDYTVWAKTGLASVTQVDVARPLGWCAVDSWFVSNGFTLAVSDKCVLSKVTQYIPTYHGLYGLDAMYKFLHLPIMGEEYNGLASYLFKPSMYCGYNQSKMLLLHRIDLVIQLLIAGERLDSHAVPALFPYEIEYLGKESLEDLFLTNNYPVPQIVSDLNMVMNLYKESAL